MTNNTTNKVAPEERWKAAISSALAQHKAPAPENNDTSAVLVRKDSRYWDGRDQVVTVQRKKTEQQISGEEEKKKQKQRRRHRRFSLRFSHDYDGGVPRDFDDPTMSRKDEKSESDGWVLMPTSLFCLCWDLVIAIFILYVAIVTPLRIGFPAILNHIAFEIIDHTMDVTFVIDLVLNFFIAVEINGVLYTDLAIIRHRYTRGWFALDVCASIPVGTLMWATGTDNSAFSDINKGFRIVRAIKLTRVFKILQEGRFGVLIEQVDAVFKFNPGTARIFKMLGALVILWHWIGCFYWSIASVIGFGHDDWVPAPHLENATFDEQYSQAFYWSLVVTVGIGYDIFPRQTTETAFTSAVIIIGLLVYCSIIGGVTHVIANMDVVSVKHKERMDFVNNFLSKKHVPNHVVRRVKGYYQYLWKTNQSMDDADVLEGLPRSLQLEIAVHNYGKVLMKCKVFNAITTACLTYIVESTRTLIFLPGDIVLKQGHPGQNMYFIVSGEVEVTCNFTGSGSTRSSSFSSEASLNETESKHNASDNRFSTWIADLGEGSIFGECSVLYGELCNANVRAVSFINCLVLSKKDLSVGCRLYPELLSRLEELAVERKQELAEIQDENEEEENGGVPQDVTESEDTVMPMNSPKSTKMSEESNHNSRHENKTRPPCGMLDDLLNDPWSSSENEDGKAKENADQDERSSINLSRRGSALPAMHYSQQFASNEVVKELQIGQDNLAKQLNSIQATLRELMVVQVPTAFAGLKTLSKTTGSMKLQNA